VDKMRNAEICRMEKKFNMLKTWKIEKKFYSVNKTVFTLVSYSNKTLSSNKYKNDHDVNQTLAHRLHDFGTMTWSSAAL